ncbi:glycosyltransferase family 4 protein [Kytococcus sedentarius]|uniref:glycosyltransferase family 4 protein n=1 Tax=Kytococcus sedentarius TaxID=1276 RepID=UPI00194E9512|nr:glycosyltransferase family 4 protein [Kytococcus sedentarius]QRO86721.1 glycosyltransferase family 4 protein [Kytococcus sedentarius]
MRITYIHQHYKAPGQPGGSRPREFARRLARDGNEVTVIAAGSGPEFVDGYQVKWLPVSYNNSMGRARRIGAFFNFMVRATLVASRLPADLVFASSTPLTVAVPGIVASKCQRSPFVFEVRDVWPELPIALNSLPRPAIAPARFLERRAYHSARDVIALSPGMKKSILATHPKASVHVIPNAADPDEYSEYRINRTAARRQLGYSDDRPLVVYAGSIGRAYDPAWLAEFAIEANARNVQFVALGHGAGLEKARAACAAAGLDPSSVFLGAFPKTEAMQVVAAADWALSSLIAVDELEVNSLNKVFDAWGVGTPVLFNHGGWLAQIGETTGAGVRLPRDVRDVRWNDVFFEATNREMQPRRDAALRLAQSRFDREKLYQVFRRVLLSA